MEGEEEEEKGWTFIKTMAGDYKRAECFIETAPSFKNRHRVRAGKRDEKKGERDITCQEYDKISIE